jgi:saccharopine dehydrogenase-like NADP-dependent oxidoreductase
MQRRDILVLGAGLISPPLVRYLLARTPHRVVVAAKQFGRVREVLEQYPRGRLVELDAGDAGAVASLVREADAVVSLLPAPMTPQVAELAIERRIPLINTSYATDELRALDARARNAGVLVLAECGLDPGIDHMSAIREIRRVHALGGRALSLISAAGGFPAAGSADNPWGYKFSWSPRAAFVAARSSARYRRRGETVELSPAELFSHTWSWEVPGHGVFEMYANRDSLRYEEAYDLAGIPGIFRGTLRRPGWCETLRALVALGLLDLEEIDLAPGATFADLTARRLPPGAGSLVERVAAQLGAASDSPLLARLEWAGLLSDRPLGHSRRAPLDLLVERVGGLMSYRPGERDMVVLEHRLQASFPDRHTEELTLRLVARGEPWGDSAMARSASLPAAIATRLALAKRIEAVGVQIPLLPEIYLPVLNELEELGLHFDEQRRARFPDPLAGA